MSLLITLGNAAPHESHPHDPENPEHVARLERRGGRLEDHGSGLRHIVPLDPAEASYTDVVVPDDWSALKVVHNLAGLDGGYGATHWSHHSSQKPTYVVVHATDGDKRAALVHQLLHDVFDLPVVDGPVALVTNAGYDFAAKQLSGAASATAVAKWMALTANATAPAAGDTSLTGEITTAGGGLVRAAAAYAHTASATTYTLSNTFTANGSDALPVTVNKMGVFDASSVGNMPYETAISPAITFNASGDAGTITETVNLA